jgi:hypothetical protein
MAAEEEEMIIIKKLESDFGLDITRVSVGRMVADVSQEAGVFDIEVTIDEIIVNDVDNAVVEV